MVFGALPLFHSFGQTVALNCAVSGARLTLLPRFDATQAVEIFERDSVTVLAGVPTMYGEILRAAHATDWQLPALRVCVSGGAALPVELLHRFEARFAPLFMCPASRPR